MEIFALPEEQAFTLPLDCDFDEIFLRQLDAQVPESKREPHPEPNGLNGQRHELEIGFRPNPNALDDRVENGDKKMFRSKSSRNILSDRKGSYKKSRTNEITNVFRRTKSEDHTRLDSPFSPNASWRQTALGAEITAADFAQTQAQAQPALDLNPNKLEQQKKNRKQAESHSSSSNATSNANASLNRNRQMKEFPAYTIAWDSFDIPEETKHVLKTQVPKAVLEELLTLGEAAFVKHKDVITHLTKPQKEAIRYIRKKTRAERKSRREKIRRIHVNNLLETLAATLELDNENRDMASILQKAIDYVHQTKDELRVLKSSFPETKIHIPAGPVKPVQENSKSDPMVLSPELF